MPITAVFQMLALLVLLVLTPLSSRAITMNRLPVRGVSPHGLCAMLPYRWLPLILPSLGQVAQQTPAIKSLGKLMASTLDEGAGEWIVKPTSKNQCPFIGLIL